MLFKRENGKLKIKNKMAFTILIFVTVTLLCIFKIPIQDNWVVTVKWLASLMTAGFLGREVTKVMKK